MVDCNGANGYAKSDQSFLREYNTRKILNILRNYKSLSRVEIAKISRLDKKTVTNIINSLLESGQVAVVLKKNEGLGRPKEMLSLEGNFCRSIGLDIGGTHISGMVLDFQGNTLSKYWLDIDCNVEPEELLKYCEHVIGQLLKRSGLDIKDILGIGVSFPGHLDNESGFTVLSENLPNWHNIEIKRLFEQKLKKEIQIEDCSRLMALAELWYGHGLESDNLIIYDLGFGIGSGLIMNHDIFTGANDKSGEVGHTILKEDGPKCTCGRTGCLEALASGWALLNHAQRIVNQFPDGILARTTKSNQFIIKTQDIALAADLGDEECRKLLESAGHYIAMSIANAISFLNPEKVVLGGSLIQDNAVLHDSIMSGIKEQVIPELYKDTKIEKSNLGRFASAMGAATLFLKGFYQ
ncbi:MAG: ROK family protein [Sphaerochaetaceae bacterium]|jgi:predicted NBD/HSP70 family sugar kinase|nr:ROK family protein [Sphaerochaetaceae bacterium]MDD2405003.1 ROK family protein [Sphaerochaetaceae bacterium]